MDRVGKWFHTFFSDGSINWQGQVLALKNDGSYLVQLFSWENREPNCQKIVSPEHISKWKFYDTEEPIIREFNKFNNIGKTDTDIIIDLGKKLGFGYVMKVASEAWFKSTGNGAFVVGPCKGETVNCPCDSPQDCDICAGTGWITKGVHKLLKGD